MDERQILFVKYDIESRLWKIGLYTPIEAFRRHHQQVPHALDGDANPVETLLKLAQETLESLIKSLQFLPVATLSKTSALSCPPWGVAVARLADVWRYKAALIHSGNVEELTKCLEVARDLYERAALLSPNNGLVFNQLSLLSIQLHHSALSSVYLAVRALSVRSPFPQASETLATLFLTNKQADEDFLHLQGLQKRARKKAGKGSSKVVDEDSCERVFLRM
ncbi:hypothetical protein HDV05_007454, partial [Chytridiales sp. JEL 0842]